MSGEFSTVVTDEILNNYHKGALDDAVNKIARYRGKLRKEGPDFGEGNGKFQLKLSGMWATKMGGDGGAWPAGADPTRPIATIQPVLFQDTVSIGYTTFKAANTGKSSFYPRGILADRVETATAEGAKYRNIVFVGSNQGRLGVVESDGTASFVMDKDPTGIQLIKTGMSLEARDALTSGNISGSFENQRVTSVDRATRTVNYAGSERTLSAGDHIFVYGSYGRVPFSLFDIVDDGTNLTSPWGVSRDTHPESKATVHGNGGTPRELDEQILMDVIAEPMERTGEPIDTCFCGSGVARRFTKFVAQDKFFPQSGGAPEYAVGFGGTADGYTTLRIFVGHINVTLFIEYDAPPRVAFFVPWRTFGLYEADPMDWVTEAGGMLHLEPGAADGPHNAQINAYLASLENVFCEMPSATARLEDIADPLVGDA